MSYPPPTETVVDWEFVRALIHPVVAVLDFFFDDLVDGAGSLTDVTEVD